MNRNRDILHMLLPAFFFLNEAAPAAAAPLALAEAELSYPERSVLTLVNAARLDPPRYGTLFLGAKASVLAGTAALPPLFHDTDLWKAARAHSEDMASCKRMSHSSCDGTAWDARIKRYLPNASSYAENVAAGQGSALAVMDSWLNSSGHRANILSRSTRIGCGHSSKGGGNWWTQTFASGGKDPDSVFAAGSHFIAGKEIRFWVNVSRKGAGALKGVQLLLDGKPHAMTLALGKAEAGGYEVKLPVASGCRSYRFAALREGGSGGNLGVYPREGSLRTLAEGGCMENWTAASSSALGDKNEVGPGRKPASPRKPGIRLAGLPQTAFPERGRVDAGGRLKTEAQTQRAAR